MHVSLCICSGPGEKAPQVCITSAEGQEVLLLVLKCFLCYADLITKGSFALRVVSCVDSLLPEEVQVHTAAFPSMGMLVSLYLSAPLHMYVGG